MGGRLWTIRICQQPLQVCPPSGSHHTSGAFPTLISDELGPAFISKGSTSFLSSTSPFFTPPPQNRTKNHAFSLPWFPNPAGARESFEIGARLRMGRERMLVLLVGRGWRRKWPTEFPSEGERTEISWVTSAGPLESPVLSFPFPTKCLSFTTVFPLLVLHPWDRDNLLVLLLLPWVSL